jgi:EAL domain-containing protein (putative c-di-GMP-specific phosphodiesterase class I)
MRHPLEFEGQQVDISVSIGIAEFPQHGSDADTLLRCADTAMYVAKKNSGGYAFYDPRFAGAQLEHLSMLSELRRAVEDTQLRAYYQPKIDIATGRIKGVEALVRWQHPMRGLLSPAEFIDYAERTGFIRMLTRWMLKVTVRQCGIWNANGTPLEIALNVSVRDVMSRDFPQIVGDLLKMYDVPAQLLCLEITESSFIEDPDQVLATLRELRALGVRLAIDDFGTGFSSLSYLKKLPVDELKIDRSFVMGMTSLADDLIIVSSTIELAHNLGLRVVAEGVENSPCLQQLRALGCDMAQGYHISRPLRRVALESWLRQSRWGWDGGATAHADQRPPDTSIKAPVV